MFDVSHGLLSTEHWNWDKWTGQEQEEGYSKEEEEYDGEASEASGPHCEDEDFIVSQLHFYFLHYFILWLAGHSLTESRPVKTDGRRLRPQPAECLQEEEEEKGEEEDKRGYATNGQKEKEVSLCRGHHQKQTCVWAP